MRKYSKMAEAALGMARGRTEDRPTAPSVGDIFYNGTLGLMEVYTADGWSGDIQESTSGIPFGGTIDRPTAAPGQPFFNGDESRLELYTTANGWQNIVQETPAVVGVSGIYLESVGSAQIQINGTNFAAGATAFATGTDGVEITADSTTTVSVVEITATFSNLTKANAPYDIKVVNPSNLYGILYDTLRVDAMPVWISQSGTLGTYLEGSTISVTLSATDIDSNNITFSLTSGALPPGLSLSSSGVISGTLEDIDADTTYSFTLNASDGANTSLRNFSITVTDNGPSWSTAESLPLFSKNLAYSTNLVATDDNGIASYSIIAGSLPAGLSLNATTGEISGTPTAETKSIFTVRATDVGGKYVDRQFTIDNTAPAWISAVGPIADGFNSGVAYSHSLAASDDSDVTYSIIAGSLPDGLALDSATGEISGTPTANSGSSFTVRVEDANGSFEDREFSLHAKPEFTTAAGTITRTTQLAATAYDSQTIQSYSIVSGTLQAGLSMSASGLFSGNPTEVGTKTFTVRVTDSLGFFAEREFSIVTTLTPATSTFEYTGSMVSYTVPATSLQFDVYGASGGRGGLGGRVTGTLSNLTIGQSITIVVGGEGVVGSEALGGYNGGGRAGGYRGNEGSGGGASDIRLSSNVDSRIVVAGGGGGGGGYAGADGAPGGGLIANAGGSGQGAGGQGGTQSSGGSGGASNGGSSSSSGGFGFGGYGGSSWNAGGGGGGGGWYGGGGGGADDNSCCSDGGGGGGGSSFAHASYTSNVTHTVGARSGNGLITLSYDQIS